MGVKVNNYIDLAKRQAVMGEDGYFIEPCIIKMMLFDELKLSNPEEFLNGACITITEDEIIEFLDKKMDEEQPGLRETLEEELKTSSSSIIAFTEDEEENLRKINASSKKMKDMGTASRYCFEPYSLQYFKIYTSKLKERLTSLFSVLDDIDRCGTEELSEESKQRLKDIDFHINSKGDIYYKDAERLANAIIDSAKDLREKLETGNNPETYLNFKESKHQLMKDDVWPNELYPSTKIQIKDRYYANRPGFIALSEAQQTEVQREEIESHLCWMTRSIREDDQKGPVLQMVNPDAKNE